MIINTTTRIQYQPVEFPVKRRWSKRNAAVEWFTCLFFLAKNFVIATAFKYTYEKFYNYKFLIGHVRYQQKSLESGPTEYKCADEVLDNLVKQDNENCVCKTPCNVARYTKALVTKFHQDNHQEYD